MKRVVFVLLLISLILTGCIVQEESPEESPEERTSGSESILSFPSYGELERIVDEEAGVVCWFYTSYKTGAALDCMPISDTKLEEK